MFLYVTPYLCSVRNLNTFNSLTKLAFSLILFWVVIGAHMEWLDVCFFFSGKVNVIEPQQSPDSSTFFHGPS